MNISAERGGSTLAAVMMLLVMGLMLLNAQHRQLDREALFTGLQSGRFRAQLGCGPDLASRAIERQWLVVPASRRATRLRKIILPGGYCPGAW